MPTASPVRSVRDYSPSDLIASQVLSNKSRTALRQGATDDHSGQPWAALSFAALLRYRDIYWAMLHDPNLAERERHLYDRWCAEIVEEIGLRLVLRVEAGR